VPRNRLFTLFTGFNEIQYSNLLTTVGETFLEQLNRLQPENQVVLFRGRYAQEAGIELIIEVAKICIGKNIQFIIATNKYPIHLPRPANVVILEKFLSEEEIVKLYQRAECCLGQISKARRLSRTIPHKAFEAGYFGKPYVTADNLGIREFLPGDFDALYLDKLDPSYIAGRLIEFLGDHERMALLGTNIQFRYAESAHQATLRKNLDLIILRKVTKNIQSL
jgi:glycosyltransferase involved in cell wall biosynthesis